jgi:hypothetical protein
LYPFIVIKVNIIVDDLMSLPESWVLGKGRGYMLVCMADNDHEYSPAVPKNTWVHLAFVKSGSEITFYVNGTAQGNPIDHGMNINDSDGNLHIGLEGST